VLITHWHWQKKKEEGRPQGLEGVPCKWRVNPGQKVFSGKVMGLERAVND
jgi:hypothetical protein